MAITEKCTPAGYVSAHEDVWYVASSSNVAQPNFKFVFDVYINAVLVSRLKIAPDPTHNLGACNIGEIVRSYLTNYYFTGQNGLINGVIPETRLYITVTVKYGEEYGSPVTTYTNLTTATAVKCYNYYNSAGYRSIADQLVQFADNYLSSGPTTRTVTINDSNFVYYWNKAAVNFDVIVKTYNSAGTLVATVTDTVLAANLAIGLNVGPVGINNSHASTILSTTSYYTVTIDNHTTQRTMTFNIDCFPKFIHYNIVFLNQWGGFESYPFRMKSSRRLEFEKKTFGRKDYTYASNGVINYTDASDGDNVLRGNAGTYSTKFKQKLHLSTDFLSDVEFIWLEQLALSPVVYLEQLLSGGTFYLPVKVEATSYDIKSKRNDKLNCLEIDIEILQNYNAQFS